MDKSDKEILSELLSLASTIVDEGFLKGLFFLVAKDPATGKLHAASPEEVIYASCEDCFVYDLTPTWEPAYLLFRKPELLQPCVIFAPVQSESASSIKVLADLIEPLTKLQELNDLVISEVESLAEVLPYLSLMVTLSIELGVTPILLPSSWPAGTQWQVDFSAQIAELINGRLKAQAQEYLKELTGNSDALDGEVVFVSSDINNTLYSWQAVKLAEEEFIRAGRSDLLLEAKAKMTRETVERYIWLSVLNETFVSRTIALGNRSDILLVESWQCSRIEDFSIHYWEIESSKVSLTPLQFTLMKLLAKKHIDALDSKSHQQGKVSDGLWAEATLASFEALK